MRFLRGTHAGHSIEWLLLVVLVIVILVVLLSGVAGGATFAPVDTASLARIAFSALASLIVPLGG